MQINEIKFTNSTLIVLINWQNYGLTIECLEHLKPLIKAAEGFVKIALIENGSTNNSSEELNKYLTLNYKYSKLSPDFLELNLEAAQPDLYFIQNTENTGFSGGVNLGCQLAFHLNCDYSFLLNSDALLPLETLPNLIHISKKNKNAIVGPQLFISENAPQPYFNGRVWPGYLFGDNASKLPSDLETIETAYVEGSAMLLPMDFIKEKLQKTGYLMDDRMFLYCEDVDLCRSALSLGYPCLVAQNSKAFHSISNSSGGKGNTTAYYYITRNRVLVAKKWLSKSQYILFNIYYVTSRLCIAFVRLFLNGYTTSNAIVQGLLDAYRDQWGKRKT
jgi:GT2 family glycosyltransferase